MGRPQKRPRESAAKVSKDARIAPTLDRFLRYDYPGFQDVADIVSGRPVIRPRWQRVLYRGVMGPVGSGKSTACCVEIIRRAQAQAPSPDGWRRTRWAVVRNTYRELQDTTIKTFQGWFGPAGFRASDMVTTWTMPDPSGKGGIGCEILWRSLDRPEQVKKLLSLELTGAWVNEAREVPLGIIEALGDRVGRYPAVNDGGCSWRGVIMDTNPPDDDHWWYKLAEESRPASWMFFRQPGGLLEVNGKFIENPEAENLDNLEPGYYLDRSQGKKPGHVRVYYCAQYGFIDSGRPVFPEYVDARHVAPDVLDPVRGLPVYVGIDFGLTPAAVFGQILPNGRWIWVDELVTENMGALTFGKLLADKVAKEYPDMEIHYFGDPAGDQRSQVDERTPYQMLAASGIAAKPAPTNDFDVRREAVAQPLLRDIDGLPGLLVSPKCHITRKGLAGGYCYKRVQVAGEDRFKDAPDKNKYSHPVEAAGYMMLGAGEGFTAMRGTTGGNARLAALERAMY